MTHTKPRTITLRLTPDADAALTQLIKEAQANYPTLNQSDVLNKIILDAYLKLIATLDVTEQEQSK